MKSFVLILGCLAVISAGDRTKRQAITFGSEPRPGQADCLDYAGRLGRCGTLQNCPFWLRVVSNSPRAADISDLRSSICGRRLVPSANGRTRRIPLVCCVLDNSPNKPSKPSRPPTRGPTRRPTRPTRRPTGRPTRPTRPTGRPTEPEPSEPSEPSSNPRVPEDHPNRRLLPVDTLCGTNIHERIVGGDEADIGEYPWLAILGYTVARTGGIEFNCGGTLINDNYVVTAAHCVTNLPADFKLSLVRLGEYDQRTERDCRTVNGVEECAEPVQDFGLSEVIPHPDYNKPNRFWNDIALLRLDRPVQKDAFVSPICLPFGEARTKDYVGQKLWVAGFGLTAAFGQSSNRLQELRVPVVDNSQCAAVFRSQRAVIGPLQMCAGAERGKDSCSGDSGGPLMGLARFGPPYRLLGVVSFGVTRCGTANVPGVYTRVSEYVNWIMDNLRE